MPGWTPSAAAERGEHAVHGLDDIGAGLAEDITDHGRLIVDEADVAQVLDRIDHVAPYRASLTGAPLR